MARTMLLSECVTISDQGYSLRVIHVLASKRWERDQDLVLVCHFDVCLTGTAGFE